MDGINSDRSDGHRRVERLGDTNAQHVPSRRGEAKRTQANDQRELAGSRSYLGCERHLATRSNSQSHFPFSMGSAYSITSRVIWTLKPVVSCGVLRVTGMPAA